MSKKLEERFVRIENVQARLGVSIDAIRQAILLEELPVYALITNVRALPGVLQRADREDDDPMDLIKTDSGYLLRSESGTIHYEGPHFFLGGFYRVVNLPLPIDAIDQGLLEAVSDPAKVINIWSVIPDEESGIPWHALTMMEPLRCRLIDLWVDRGDLHADGERAAKDPDAVRDGENSGKSRKAFADQKREIVGRVAREIIAERSHFTSMTAFAKSIQKRVNAFKPPTDASRSLAEGSIRTITDALKDEGIEPP